MKCRRVIKQSDDSHEVVYFGSNGLVDPKFIYFSVNSVVSSKEYKEIMIDGVNRKIQFGEIVSDLIITNLEDVNNKLSITFENLNNKYTTIKVVMLTFTDEPSNYGLRHGETILNLDFSESNIITIETTILKNAKVVTDYKDKYINTNGQLTLNNDYNNGLDNSYHTAQDGVADSLIQRLAIIKGELWYQINYGIPLFDKNNNTTGIFDSAIIKIVLDHPDVKNIISFNSSVESKDHKYHFDMVVDTKYNTTINISNLVG